MLEWLIADPLGLRAAQAGLVAVLAFLIALWAKSRGVDLLGQTTLALGRGVVQIVAVGVALVALFAYAATLRPLWATLLGAPVLTLMIIVAGIIAARRARGIPGIYRVAISAVAVGAGSTIVIMSALGAMRYELYELIPVGSMLIANSMNTSAQALERFRSDVTNNTGLIEAGLALGADPRQTVAPYLQAAMEASMIPRIDSLASLGIVWIPGLMAGMIIGGTSPVEAALYNFAVIAMIYASSALTAFTAMLLVRREAFSPAEQLLLRPVAKKKKAAH